MKKVSIGAQIMEVEYELAMRRSVYQRQVSTGKMKRAEATLHTEQMEAVLATLKFVRDNEDDFRAFMAAKREVAA
ncbi:hypothetical protein [Devosia elaeis]|uniref:Transposase n=1 Tax=Devosia elaeis TaxID=1770058 RepID=A0A178HLP4_9HYPH|nr:hypothetical protein [Devosia elaeis]OAM73741.1 hypothetical protein A3840_17250 [Devosia elaeis]